MAFIGSGGAKQPLSMDQIPELPTTKLAASTDVEAFLAASQRAAAKEALKISKWEDLGVYTLDGKATQVIDVRGYRALKFFIAGTFPASSYQGIRLSFDNGATFVATSIYNQSTIYNNGGTLVATAQAAQTIFVASATQESTSVQATAEGTITWFPGKFVHLTSRGTGATNALGITNALQTAFANIAQYIPTHVSFLAANTTWTSGILEVEGLI